MHLNISSLFQTWTEFCWWIFMQLVKINWENIYIKKLIMQFYLVKMDETLSKSVCK